MEQGSRYKTRAIALSEEYYFFSDSKFFSCYCKTLITDAYYGLSFDCFKQGTEQSARPPLEFHTPINEKFSSAFFFVFHKTSTSLKNANEKDSASMSCNWTRSNSFKASFQIQDVFTILMTVHVRWPARPAELWAGLDFFVTFCIKAKSKWCN